MKKKVVKTILSEKALYYGNINMPKHWEIDRNYLSHEIFIADLHNDKYKFNTTWDKLNKYVQEFINLKHDLNLVNHETWGNIYKPSQLTNPILNVNLVDLKNSSDFTLLYGVNVSDCHIKIYYDDNRRKGKTWDIQLRNNMFVMFPSTCSYVISNNQKDSLNFVQTITYVYI